MSEVMKIFIGANEYGTDFFALKRLQQQSKKENYHCFRHWITLAETLGYFSLLGKEAILRGGYTGICVTHSIEFLLENNIDYITVDLPYCRYDQHDFFNTVRSINRREKDIISELIPEYKEDKRLKFRR
jgi:hypothetical protein